MSTKTKEPKMHPPGVWVAKAILELYLRDSITKQLAMKYLNDLEKMYKDPAYMELTNVCKPDVFMGSRYNDFVVFTHHTWACSELGWDRWMLLHKFVHRKLPTEYSFKKIKEVASLN